MIRNQKAPVGLVSPHALLKQRKEKEKVRVAVSAALRVLLELVMETKGRLVSMLKAGDWMVAVPALPTAAPTVALLKETP